MLVFSDLFDVVSEFSLEVIWMVICLKLNADADECGRSWPYETEL